jgi:hypothetical protein
MKKIEQGKKVKADSFLTICNYSSTIRLMPQNYWIATIKDGKLIFDSWDGMTKQLFKEGAITKPEVIKFYNNNQ